MTEDTQEEDGAAATESESAGGGRFMIEWKPQCERELSVLQVAVVALVFRAIAAKPKSDTRRDISASIC